MNKNTLNVSVKMATTKKISLIISVIEICFVRHRVQKKLYYEYFNGSKY